jgi:hypothetical protein
MTKQEKIKQAYGSDFKRCKPDENGWTHQGKVFCPTTEIGKSKREIQTRGSVIRINNSNVWWRPIELKGIETNNGWVKINSDDDLPTLFVDCYALLKTNKIFTFEDVSENDIRLIKLHATHYKLIEKPLPPVY